MLLYYNEVVEATQKIYLKTQTSERRVHLRALSTTKPGEVLLISMSC